MTPKTLSLKSPNEKRGQSSEGEEEKGEAEEEEGQFMISHFSEQRRREKKNKYQFYEGL